MMHPLHLAVSALMRDVGARIVMPRFRALEPSQIEEKAPNELVTVADKESEAALAEGLLSLLPEARVIGEEACAADEALAGTVGDGLVWIVDPIDGTHNFATGTSPFAIMVALADNGVSEAAWILDPASGRLCHASRGRGAYIDEAPVTARGSGEAKPVAGLSVSYLPPDLRTATSPACRSRAAPGSNIRGSSPVATTSRSSGVRSCGIMRRGR